MGSSADLCCKLREKCKYWLRVAAERDIPALVKDAYIMAKTVPYCGQIILSRFWMTQYVWINPASVDPVNFMVEFEERLTDQFQQRWEGELKASTGKMRTYKLIKQDMKLESTLSYHLT